MNVTHTYIHTYTHTHSLRIGQRSGHVLCSFGGCEKRAIFGQKIGTFLWCRAHKGDGDVDTFNVRCVYVCVYVCMHVWMYGGVEHTRVMEMWTLLISGVCICMRICVYPCMYVW